jgi:surface polysaccharide O-acyltransferase-like enzyme
MTFPDGRQNYALFNTAACSTLITFIYAANTLIAFDLTRRLPLPRLVAFLARNTLITVIVHMQLIYAYAGQFYGLIEDPILKRLALVAILFVGISLFSEILNRLLPVKKMSNATWSLCARPLLWIDGFIAKRAHAHHMNTT